MNIPFSSPVLIYTPSDRILSEAYTILNLSVGYAMIQPRITRRTLVGWVYDRVIECNALVIGVDGTAINLHEINVDETFGDDSSWAGDFLSAKFRMPRQRPAKRIIARYRLLWIALASVMPKVADDVLR